MSLLNGRRLAMIATALLVGACATDPAPSRSSSKAAPSELDRIGYEISACRGFCPSYRFSISTDGNAHFEGLRSTRVAGHAPIDATPRLFRDIRDSLATARTAENRNITLDNCSNYTTDQQVVTVTWEKAGKIQSSLVFDLGCHDPRYGEMRRSLAAARKLLPIDEAVGRATDF